MKDRGNDDCNIQPKIMLPPLHQNLENTLYSMQHGLYHYHPICVVPDKRMKNRGNN